MIGAFFFGIAVAYTPCLIFLAWNLWWVPEIEGYPDD